MQTRTARSCAFFVLGVSIALAACASTHSAPTPVRSVSRTREATVRSPVVAARGGGPMSLVQAVDAITAERCRRESTCQRIGRGHEFVSMSECTQRTSAETRSILNAMACETGYVEPDALVECLTAIQKAGCDGEPSVYCDTPRMCSP